MTAFDLKNISFSLYKVKKLIAMDCENNTISILLNKF